MDKPQNVRIDGVELNWARLVKPVNPFGTEQFELQIATKDAAKAEEMRAAHLNVKEKDGVFTASLKRKAANGPVKVVDAQLNPMGDEAGKIGNGSTGNVIIWSYPYEAMGRKGIGASLTAVQVTNLVRYEADGVGFDAVDTGAAEASSDTSLF